jgi:tight adherence protein B
MAIIYSVLFGVMVLFVSYQYNVRFLDWLRFQSLGTRDYVTDKLNMMFYDVKPNQVLLGMAGSALFLFLVFFLLFLPKLLPGLIFGCLGAFLAWKLPRPIVDYMVKRRTSEFNNQMVDALNLMANAMKSGLSVAQSMGIVVDQCPQPISQEFNLVLSETKIGLSLEESLINLSKRVQCEDVEMFVTAVVILKETGGNLAETFDTIVSTIRERIKVQSKIDAMTASGFIQGMVLLAMPPAIGIFFSVSEPGFMDPLFNTPIGWGVLLAVLILEISAFVMIKKVMKIDV